MSSPPSPVPAIRQYQPADRSTCLDIFDSNRPKYFAEHERGEFAAWLDDPHRAVYSVIEIGGAIVACGGIYHDGKKNHVGLAWGMVRQDMQGQQIGTQLTQFRIDQMTQLFPALEQHLGTSQHTFRFYEKQGFVVTDVIGDGFGEGIDRYNMVRSPRGDAN